MVRGEPGSAARLDAFVDAAFAFAVTLLVIGGGGVPSSYGELDAALSAAPAFAVGFALIAMFWYAHVRWRGYGTAAGPLPVLFSLLLVFFVLLYVYPLRLMALTLAQYLGGDAVAIGRDQHAGLYAMYGLGFMAMAACITVLFALSLRASRSPAERATVLGDVVIWAMLAASGLISALLTLVAAPLAPWVYSLLPVAIGLFVWRHDWEGAGAAGEGEETPLPAEAA